jgi:hypothetical protein
MDPKLKKVLRGISLDIRRLLDGRYDERGQGVPGDLEDRLKGMGVWRARNSKPIEELPQLSAEDKAARRLVNGYLKLREEAGVSRPEAVGEFVRESVSGAGEARTRRSFPNNFRSVFIAFPRFHCPPNPSAAPHPVASVPSPIPANEP